MPNVRKWCNLVIDHFSLEERIGTMKQKVVLFLLVWCFAMPLVAANRPSPRNGAVGEINRVDAAERPSTSNDGYPTISRDQSRPTQGGPLRIRTEECIDTGCFEYSKCGGDGITCSNSSTPWSCNYSRGHGGICECSNC